MGQRELNRRFAKMDKDSHVTSQWEQMVEFFGGLCILCLKPSVTKDHIVPLALGGGNDIRNMQPLCKPCNMDKGTSCYDLRPERCEAMGVKMPRKWKLKKNQLARLSPEMVKTMLKAEINLLKKELKELKHNLYGGEIMKLPKCPTCEEHGPEVVRGEISIESISRDYAQNSGDPESSIATDPNKVNILYRCEVGHSWWDVRNILEVEGMLGVKVCANMLCGTLFHGLTRDICLTCFLRENERLDDLSLEVDKALNPWWRFWRKKRNVTWANGDIDLNRVVELLKERGITFTGEAYPGWWYHEGYENGGGGMVLLHCNDQRNLYDAMTALLFAIQRGITKKTKI